MSVHNVTDSALLVKKSRKTIQRYIANGKLSVTRNELGHPQIDTAELIRVFGKLSQVSQKKINKKSHSVAPDLSQQKEDSRIDKLLNAVERLEKVVEKQSEQIASLLKLEHKPIVDQPIEQPTNDTAKQVELSSCDYLDGISFITKK